MRQSIARRLNSRLFWRLVGIFLFLDLFICLLTAGGLVYYSELQAEKVIKIIAETGLPESGAWLELSNIRVSASRGDGGGAVIPQPFSYMLPVSTRRGLRAVDATGDITFFGRIDELSYIIIVEQDDVEYRIAVALEPFLRVFRVLLILLLVYEFLTVLSKTGKNRRMVRRELDPISALTRATMNLNAVSKQLDPDKMAALAGKLEGINASRLDTRIQIDDTQAELKSLAQAINGMLDRINESYRAQVRFVSDASHELRTPISVIQGYANLLDRWGKNDEKTLQESIHAIKDEAANMKDLVEQLLFLARGDNDTIMLQPEVFSLAELAREVTGEFAMIDATHHFELKAGSEAIVRADRGLIKQALRILVDNAVKYTDPGGHITLATSADGATATISVSDDGIGIKPEAVGHIFERFYRADASRARATGGAGLGLSIAQWITYRHNGHLEVLSREGIGTRISVLLPASNAPASNAPASNAPAISMPAASAPASRPPGLRPPTYNLTFGAQPDAPSPQWTQVSKDAQSLEQQMTREMEAQQPPFKPVPPDSPLPPSAPKE
jgi:signal transduction histidine kinase